MSAISFYRCAYSLAFTSKLANGPVLLRLGDLHASEKAARKAATIANIVRSSAELQRKWPVHIDLSTELL